MAAQLFRFGRRGGAAAQIVLLKFWQLCKRVSVAGRSRRLAKLTAQSGLLAGSMQPRRLNTNRRFKFQTRTQLFI
jgi:hypothetical protein